ncbi:cytochrome d ubiquinol oxidase subunit II [Pseudomonas sp. GD03842]|uniref:cytochrome d ubiquinol oxidase subunit II n=1 Tax=Pseudomonas sp. GD03842 TaxID=2975385 RepID=UPI00244A351F|nr:cytochrome d ubiquinol oxidase subunit II [Pseudomonas sp. GD03842]MDH0747825.1 cytochrome d ubiquinol oxidase subunit II [Pseudomonas sp. GD03842]
MEAPDWLIWLSAAALGFSVLSYVLLDGTDLGTGIWLGLTRDGTERRAMALSILPIWDANETWLVLGGGGLLALFPKAYAILVPALYLPFIVMFTALIVRAMALEFRDEVSHPQAKRSVDALHMVASVLAAACQGVVLGTLVVGVPTQGGQFSGTGWEWFNAFSLYSGAVLVLGYGWLGACWLNWRCVGSLQQRARTVMAWLALVTLLLLAALLLWTASLNPLYEERLSHHGLLAGAVGATGILYTGFFLALHRRRAFAPLCFALAVFAGAFLLMVLTLYPFIVPPVLTLTDAASSPASQRFMLVGFAVLMPLTLLYNTFGFRVFSGKVRPLADR